MWVSPTTYTGHPADMVLGVYYAKARMYDAGDRRFMAEDPILDGLNYYTYCYNNPLKYKDPWGLFGWNGDDNYWFEDFKGEVETAGGTIRFVDNGLNNGWEMRNGEFSSQQLEAHR